MNVISEKPQIFWELFCQSLITSKMGHWEYYLDDAVNECKPDDPERFYTVLVNTLTAMYEVIYISEFLKDKYFQKIQEYQKNSKLSKTEIALKIMVAYSKRNDRTLNDREVIIKIIGNTWFRNQIDDVELFDLLVKEQVNNYALALLRFLTEDEISTIKQMDSLMKWALTDKANAQEAQSNVSFFLGKEAILGLDPINLVKMVYLVYASGADKIKGKLKLSHLPADVEDAKKEMQGIVQNSIKINKQTPYYELMLVELLDMKIFDEIVVFILSNVIIDPNYVIPNLNITLSSYLYQKGSREMLKILVSKYQITPTETFDICSFLIKAGEYIKAIHAFEDPSFTLVTPKQIELIDTLGYYQSDRSLSGADIFTRIIKNMGEQKDISELDTSLLLTMLLTSPKLIHVDSDAIASLRYIPNIKLSEFIEIIKQRYRQGTLKIVVEKFNQKDSQVIVTELSEYEARLFHGFGGKTSAHRPKLSLLS